MPDTPSNLEIARALLRRSGPATLATLDATGAPFASYVVSAPAADGSPLLLLSRLAVHTRNLARDPRASLLIVGEMPEAAQSMNLGRLTVMGRVTPDPAPDSRERFLAAHSEARAYAGFADFSVYRLTVAMGHLVAGFGRIEDLAAEDLLHTP